MLLVPIYSLFGADERKRASDVIDNLPFWNEHTFSSEPDSGIEVPDYEGYSEGKLTLQWINFIYEETINAVSKYYKGVTDIAPAGGASGELLVEPTYFSFDDFGKDTYFAVVADNFIKNQGKYRLVNYMNDSYKVKDTDKQSLKAVSILRDWFSPFVLAHPLVRSEDESVYSGEIEVRIPLLEEDALVKIYNSKEDMLSFLRKRFREILEDNFVEDTYIVSVQNIRSDAHIGEEFEERVDLVRRNNRAEFSRKPPYITIIYNITYLRAADIEPEGRLTKEAGERYKEKERKRTKKD